MRDCSSIAELLGAYVYGDLAPDEMRRVRMHIEECSACAQDLEARSRAVGLVPNDLPKLSDEERQRVIWTVKGAIRARGPRARFRVFSPGFAQGFAVAAVVVGAFAAWVVFSGKPPKAIVRQVPPRGRPSQPAEPTDRVATTPRASVKERAVPSEAEMAVAPSRREEIRAPYRHKSEGRAEAAPPKLSPAVPEENAEHPQVRPDEAMPGANLLPAPVPPGSTPAPPEEGKSRPVLTPPKIQPEGGNQQ